MHPLPGIIPTWIGEETSQDLGVQIALAGKINVERTSRKIGSCHDLVDRNIVESKPIEQVSSTPNNPPSSLLAMTGWVRHVFLLCVPIVGRFGPASKI